MADLQTVYARLEDGKVAEYPVYGLHIQNRSHPLEWYTEVQFRAKPELPPFHVYKETLTVEGSTVFANYALLPLSLDQVLAQLTPVSRDLPSMTMNPSEPPAPVVFSSIPAPTVARVIELAKEQVQKRLDDFGRTKGYDGILSACSYATSTVAEFQAEGQNAVNLRDSTWQALYSYLYQVQLGALPVPRTYADIEVQLPVLAW